MPRCYMVKKSNQRHEGPPPRSPTEASVAPPCYSPAEHSAHIEPQGADYAELRNRPLSERSAADTEAAHDLLSLAHSLPPIPPTVVTVIHSPEPTPLVPVYTYTIQPTNIYILADEPAEPIFHTIQAITPLQPVEYTVEPQVNYVAYQQIPQETNYQAPQERNYQVPHATNYQVPQENLQVPQETNYQAPQETDYQAPQESNYQAPQQNSCQLSQQTKFQAPQETNYQPLQAEFKPSERDNNEELDSDDSEPELVIVEDEPEDENPSAPKEKTGKFNCNECGKCYATSSNLSRHKQTHRSLDSVEAKRCEDCGKAYVSMPALAMHVLTHRMGHVCGVCGKQFSRPWLLRGHLRSHTGEKPYNCAACGKSFADRSNLRAHLQTHSSDKKYECQRCRKTFALKSYLNKHQESACVRPEEN